MEAPVYNEQWENIGTCPLSDVYFWKNERPDLVSRLLRLQLTNARYPIAHTKTRWERRGSTRKMSRQKGNGRARVGANRSPIRKKGWVVFWPRATQTFFLRMNKKERRLAIISLLSAKFNANNIKILQASKEISYSTKVMRQFSHQAEISSGVFVTTFEEKQLGASVNNLKQTKALYINYLNPHDLLKYTDVVFTKAALEQMFEIYS